MTSPPPFPPDGPVTLSQTIPSYLYKQFDDDSDIQAFVASFNTLAQIYVDWFTNTGLPVYTGLSGSLLDWVAQGLYGITRPTLSSGKFSSIGPLNTYEPNTWTINKLILVGPANISNTSDDIFQRIITWNFYKGDGTNFNIKWLKRRIMRFLIGENGSAPNIDNTYPVSIAFGANGAVNILLSEAFPNDGILAEAINQQVLQLPFQFSWSITLSH